MSARRAGWQFWIDRGGTFTDVVGAPARRRARHPQAAVGESRALPRRGDRGHPPPAGRGPRRADPGGPHRRGEDGHHGRDQRAAGAQGRAHGALHHARLPRRAAHRLPEPAAHLRPPHRPARAALQQGGGGRRAHGRAWRGGARRSTRARYGRSSARARRGPALDRHRASCTATAIRPTRRAWPSSRARRISRRSRSRTR